MGSISVSLDFEELKEAVKQLSEEQREELVFELQPSLGKALQRMEEEVHREHEEGETVSIDEL